MITLRNVDRAYEYKGGQTWVLRSVKLSISDGEFVSIMGPSGAGKSTLLNVLALHDAGWTGEYWLDGQPVHDLSQKQRRVLSRTNFGFVFQSFNLLDELTVFENLEVPLSYRDVPARERQAIVCDLLDRFRIVGKKDLYPVQLSGGQQQLVAVARAIVAKPRVILADEPTGNLHSDQAREIMELFRQLNEEGTTIIQVTHSEANAAFGNRVVKLVDGWVTEDRKAA